MIETQAELLLNPTNITVHGNKRQKPSDYNDRRYEDYLYLRAFINETIISIIKPTIASIIIQNVNCSHIVVTVL